jgi:hypothetical protein
MSAGQDVDGIDLKQANAVENATKVSVVHAAAWAGVAKALGGEGDAAGLDPGEAHHAKGLSQPVKARSGEGASALGVIPLLMRKPWVFHQDVTAAAGDCGPVQKPRFKGP